MTEYANMLEFVANGVFYPGGAIDIVFEQLSILDPLIIMIGSVLYDVDR